MKVYLDNAATTKVDEEVVKTMLPYFTEKYGNASSLYGLGQESAQALEKSREKVAKLINASPNEIVFTSGGSESDNLALKGVLDVSKDKDHIIISKIEHHAIHTTCEYLEKKGYKVTYLDVDKDGLVNPEDVRNAITEKTAIVSIMHANNEIGTIEPIKEIGNICKEKKVIFHTDAVQTVGKVKIDVKKMNVDMLSASSHKIHGPKGVGFLYVRNGVNIGKLIHGGGQENGLRSGTENIPGIVGFANACELALKDMEKNNKEMKRLRDKLVKGILSKISKSYLNGHDEKRLVHNAHFRFDYIEGEALLIKLDMEGISGSTGSACSTKSLKPSYVLMALGLKPVKAHGSLRLTLSKYTKEEDIDHVLDKLPKIVDELRSISPLNRENIDDFPDEDHDHGE